MSDILQLHQGNRPDLKSPFVEELNERKGLTQLKNRITAVKHSQEVELLIRQLDLQKNPRVERHLRESTLITKSSRKKEKIFKSLKKLSIKNIQHIVK